MVSDLSAHNSSEVKIMNMTKTEYNAMVQSLSPPSKIWVNVPRAYAYGGAVCCIGQAFIYLYGYLGLNTEDALTATSMTMVFLGAFLTALGVYDNIAKRGGAGTLVPITGFANAVASPALEFKTESFTLGTCTKMFTIAGPVIVYGILASTVYGVILCIIG